MFKDFIKKLKKYSNITPFDPSVIDDPIAQQVDWFPLKGGGTNICTHRLKEIDPNRLDFKATFAAKFFYGLFFIAGLIMIFAYPLKEGLLWNTEMTILICVGTLFTLVGLLLLYFGTKPIVFDLSNGMYWKNYKSPLKVLRREELKQFTELKDIHALQIIDELCRSDKSTYRSYELNLILKDGTRLNVIDHGSYKKLREDAQKLSDFLNVPLWDKLKLASLQAEFDSAQEIAI